MNIKPFGEKKTSAGHLIQDAEKTGIVVKQAGSLKLLC